MSKESPYHFSIRSTPLWEMSEHMHAFMGLIGICAFDDPNFCEVENKTSLRYALRSPTYRKKETPEEMVKMFLFLKFQFFSRN
jgi:hypothetical protein